MEKHFAIFKFKLNQDRNYCIEILHSDIMDLLRNDYKIGNEILKTDSQDKNKTFEIKENLRLQIETNKKNDETNFIGKMNYAMKIFNSKYGYYIKFGIQGSKNPDILSISFVVYYSYKNSLYPYFSANNPIKDIKSSKISSLPDTFNGDKSLEKKINQENSSKNMKTNMRSKSTINDSRSIGFSKKVNNKEFFYDYSCLNEIDTSLLAKKVTTKIFGLLNLGNTCFLNSSLQIILHSPLFVEYFLKDIHNFTPPTNTLSYILFNFIMTIYSSDDRAFSPISLITKFLEKCNIFSLGEQSDSQSFYRNFITIIDNELGNLNTCINKTFIGKFHYTNQFNCLHKFCPFRDIKEVDQPFYDLFLTVPEKNSSITELLDETYRSQEIKSSRKCKCGRNLILNRYTKISPNIYLGVNLQRAKISDRKIKNVEITIDNIIIDSKRYYAPYAINFHTGSTMDFGHYYSYIKIDGNDINSIDSGKWYCFNDSNCSIAVCPKSSKDAMNIFYRLKEL